MTTELPLLRLTLLSSSLGFFNLQSELAQVSHLLSVRGFDVFKAWG